MAVSPTAKPAGLRNSEALQERPQHLRTCRQTTLGSVLWFAETNEYATQFGNLNAEK